MMLQVTTTIGLMKDQGMFQLMDRLTGSWKMKAHTTITMIHMKLMGTLIPTHIAVGLKYLQMMHKE
jgi:hypothetical protein